MNKQIPEKLLEAAEKYNVYWENKQLEELFKDIRRELKLSYITGATSDYVEKQKEDFAIKFSQWLGNNFYGVFVSSTIIPEYYRANNSSSYYQWGKRYTIQELLTKFKENEN